MTVRVDCEMHTTFELTRRNARRSDQPYDSTHGVDLPSPACATKRSSRQADQANTSPLIAFLGPEHLLQVGELRGVAARTHRARVGFVRLRGVFHAALCTTMLNASSGCVASGRRWNEPAIEAEEVSRALRGWRRTLGAPLLLYLFLLGRRGIRIRIQQTRGGPVAE